MISNNHSGILAAGWSVQSSILMELDIAISVLTGGLMSGQTEEFRTLVQSVKHEQIEEIQQLVGSISSGLHTVLEPIAWLAGVLFEEDYARAIRAVEQLSISSALERITGEARENANLEQLVANYNDLGLETLRRNGIEKTTEANQRDLREQKLALSLLQGDQRALDFWRWLDRFYYENYQPWRISRQPVLVAQRQVALSNLGALQGDGIPLISWLSEKNPLLHIPGLHSNVENKKNHVCFWVEPFGMADTWSLFPNLIIVSFALPGALFCGFTSYAELLGSRLQALSDPTRLVILHLIRNMGMNNTDMAEYLNLSRPTVSIHARILREAGLIHTYADGRSARHEIDTQAVRGLLKDLERFLDLP